MNTFLWVLQGLLAAVFIVPGVIKTFISKAGLVEKKAITADESAAPYRFIGIMEVLGVFGVILPWLLSIYPVLTPLAAAGFAIVMVGAFVVHFSKKDYKILPALVIIFLVAVIVAWQRF
ncbi:MAG: hypothetical protein JWP94_2287 [Mucilaginibacter sp.]|jgi:hypothetical protein|nr:hypothetical protein [Mucilaginibacter sp.]